jgi:glycosyltransferase involved in cell wall biosynthesis
MSGSPLVSIITPSYNQAAFLEQTIQSVLDQDYPELEYMVIDGASSDGSQQIIARYANRLSFWTSEPDHGQAEAINKGFKRAKGEIVAWLNSDDYYLPGAVSAAVRELQADSQSGLVHGDVLAVDGEGNPINTLRYNDYKLDDLMQFRIIGQPAVFLRKSVLDKVGFLDTRFHFMLDHHLWLRIARVAPIRYVPQIWAAARFHAASKNVAQATGFAREAYEVVRWMKNDTDMQSIYEMQSRKIWAGAHLINARYLSENGDYGASMLAYWRCMLASPRDVWRDWKRFSYTLLSLIGLGRLGRVYFHLRQSYTARSQT